MIRALDRHNPIRVVQTAKARHPMTDLLYLATPGTEVSVRVTPKASRNTIRVEGEQLRVYVTTAPEEGKANAAVQKLLAKAIGIAKSRLILIRGKTSRDKVFRVD